MPFWPADISFCPIDGTLAVTPVRSIIEGPADIPGMGTRRRRYTGTFTSYSFDLLIDRADLSALLAFHNTTCQQGVFDFIANDPLDKLASATFRWQSPPEPRQHTPNGSKWRVTLSLLKIG